MTTDNQTAARNELYAVVLFLAGICDGASTRDFAGFNGAHTRPGHAMAKKIESGKDLTAEEITKAKFYCVFYHRQLENFDLELAAQATVNKSLKKVAPKTDYELFDIANLKNLGYDKAENKLIFLYHKKPFKIETITDANRELMRRCWKVAKENNVICSVV